MRVRGAADPSPPRPIPRPSFSRTACTDRLQLESGIRFTPLPRVVVSTAAVAQGSRRRPKPRHLRGQHRPPANLFSAQTRQPPSVNSANSASLATRRARPPYAPTPLQLPTRTAVTAAARPKSRAFPSPSSGQFATTSRAYVRHNPIISGATCCPPETAVSPRALGLPAPTSILPILDTGRRLSFPVPGRPRCPADSFFTLAGSTRL